jgi:hypothetical protein
VEELCALIKRVDLRLDGKLPGGIALSVGIASASENAFTASTL